FEFDNSILNNFSKRAIFKKLMLTITTVNINLYKIEHYTDYNQDPLDKYDQTSSNKENNFINNNTISNAYKLRPS
ncbi:15158_t:CDS:1, partial [Cetraspora pellucida]